MEIELRKESIQINEAVHTAALQALAEGDVIVPDAKSDIAKVLQLDAAATVDTIVNEATGMQISGRIDMTLLYVPDGDTKPVCSMPISLDFVCDADKCGDMTGAKCLVSADICHVEFSLLNARKLSVRAVVDLDVKCYRSRAVETVYEVDGGIEAKKDNLQVYNLLHTGMSKFVLKETLAFPSGKPSAVSVLKTDTRLTDKEVRVVTGKVVVKGNVQICTLYVSESNEIEFMEHELPFTEVIDAPDAREECMCELDLNLAAAQVGLSADADGDMRYLDVSVLCSAGLTVSEVADVSLVTDCFCRDKEMICETTPFVVHSLAGTGSAQATVKGTVQLGAGAPESQTIYNVVAKPYIREVQIEENCATVQGTISCYLLYLSAATSAPVSTARAKLEFSLPVSVDGLKPGMDCEIGIETLHSAYNMTMSGEIEVRCVLRLDAKAIEEKEVCLITGATIEDACITTQNGILLYFVRPGDTLWKIAKHYRVPLAVLVKVNKLENPDLIYPGQRLLIPNIPKL